MRSGTHVAVEGLDGAGKSTLIAYLADALRDDYEVREFRLPDEAAVAGEDLVRIIRKQIPAPSPDVLALAFAANRLASYEQIVEPYLAGHPDRLAISHRYLLSGFAYQHAQGVPMEWLSTLNQRLPPPTLTLFIDTDPERCARRIQARGAVELFEDEFVQMRKFFQLGIEALTDLGGAVRVVNGDRPVREVGAEALELVRGLVHPG